MSDELKPCPFCGGEARADEFLEPIYGAKPEYSVLCVALRCPVNPETRWYGRMYDAKRAWNRRAGDE